MRSLWKYLWIGLLLVSCDNSSGSGGAEPEDPVPQDPQDPPVVKDACESMVCANGCCDGKCVDFDSDANHCGRCNHKCDGFCLERQCVTTCEGETVKICGGVCVNYSSNASHCGRCDQACGGNKICINSKCQCEPGYSDCDGNAANGCESPVDKCKCITGETKSCYGWVEELAGVGICKHGVQYCEDGDWGFCENYGMPTMEIPGNGLDDDCDNEVDELVDEDGDGYDFGYGPGFDCCDNSAACGVEDPAKVNPGAIEDPNNGIDDDCDGLIDEDESVLCSTKAYAFTPGKQLTNDDAVLLARAMDICTDANKDGYGLVSAQLLLADGSPLPGSYNEAVCGQENNGLKLISPAEQVAVMTDLGDGIVRPLKGTMVALSSGKAQGKENTGMKDCSGTEVSAPALYLEKNNNVLPVSAACGVEANSKMANDSIMLRLKLKAPDNAKGFAFRFKFFSKEYPSYVCGSYNDFFLAMVDAKSDEIPADHNVSFDVNHNPVSVNNAFFTECDKDACKKEKGCSDCKDGSANVLAYVNDVKQAGATGWLQTTVPVSPKEEFTLDLIIFDAGDRGDKKNGWGHQRDSLVLIDNFEWTSDATKLETVIN
ncbi:MAG: choice-of-anchor L domain-containing protein [Proteobacteria bacterium]|nr:choice-of-anchor L domain-containing protein [Pseudomonadota bacterium]